MQTRRQFLQAATGGLAGTLLPGTAHAAGIVALELTVTPSVSEDFLGSLFYSKASDYTNLGSTVEDLLSVVVEIIALPVARLLPTRVGIEYHMTETPKTSGGIPVIFTSIGNYLEREMSDDALFSLLGEMHPDEGRDIRRLYAEYHRTGDQRIRDAVRQHVKEDQEAMTLGVTLRDRGRIYLFPRKDVAEVFATERFNANFVALGYAKYLGAVLTHELGHLFGLEHSSVRRLSTGQPNLMYSTYGMDIRETLSEDYNFSPADRRILQAKLS